MAKDANGYGRENTLLTEEVRDKIVTALGVGASVKHAADYAGISYRTLEYWMQQGRKPDPEPIYAELMEEIRKARGAGVVHSHGVLIEAKEWQAHAKRLAIIDPESYSERRIEHKTVDHQVTVRIERERLQELSDEEFEVLRRAWPKLVGQPLELEEHVGNGE